MTALKVPSLVLSTLLFERGFSIFLYKGNGIESLNHTASGRGGNVRSIGISWNTRLDIDTYILNKIEMIYVLQIGCISVVAFKQFSKAGLEAAKNQTCDWTSSLPFFCSRRKAQQRTNS